MRKIFALCLSVPLALSALPLAACSGREPRAHYRIEAEYSPETGTLTADMTVRIPNTWENAVDALSFGLYPNAFREGAARPVVPDAFAPAAYYSGTSYGGIGIASVEGARSFEVCGEDRNILSVALEEPLYPDETAELAVHFATTLAKINHRLGAGERTVNLTGFYPLLCARGENGFLEYPYTENGDPFVSECADYELVLTIPKELTAACGGKAERREEGGKAVYTVSAENVRELAVVLGNFSVATAREDKTEIAYYYTEDADPARTLEAARRSLAYFSEQFGGYAYPVYTVVQTDLPYGGVEFPMLSMISSSLRAELPFVVAHETAHQWWYAAVGSDQCAHAWQDEGLAEFSAAIFCDDAYGMRYRETVGASERAYRAYFSVAAQRGADTGMDRPLAAFSGPYEYRCIAYDKGVILLDRVRFSMGDKKFFAALRDYYARYSGKIASPADFIACFERTGARVEGLISGFLDGKCVI